MRRNHLRKLGVIAVAAGFAFAVAGCQDSGTTGGGNTAACGGKIAIFGAFTGGNAGLVLPSRDGARLAFEKFNAANPNCKAELVEFDTEGDPAKATPVANQIVGNQEILGVIGGHFSGETRATIPTYDAAGVAMVSPSATATDLTTMGSKTFHRVVGNDASQGPAAGRYIKNVLNGQRVVIVDDGSAYGAALAEEVGKVVGTPAATDKVQEKQTNFAATISKIKAANADVVFYGGYTNEAAPLLKQMRAAGVTAKFVGGDGINDAAFPQGAGATESEGALITCPCRPGAEAKGTFPADFQAKYGTPPGVYAAEGWDAATVLLDALKDGKRTRADVLAFVKAYDKEGVTKKINFDDKGEIEVANVVIFMYTVKGGQIVPDREIPSS